MSLLKETLGDNIKLISKILNFNWYLVLGYISLFQAGFITCYAAIQYIAKHDFEYLKTMPGLVAGYWVNVAFQFGITIMMLYFGNKKLKGFVVEMPKVNF